MKQKMILFLLVLLLLLTFSGSVSSLSRMGSTGKEVKDIQTALKKKGYPIGTVDGIYGTKTKNAVIAFQRDV